MCHCQGLVHELVSNCIGCGRIICVHEGEGDCLFCGEYVESHLMEVGDEKEKLKDPAYQEAIRRRDKLLGFDKEGDANSATNCKKKQNILITTL